MIRLHIYTQNQLSFQQRRNSNWITQPCTRYRDLSNFSHFENCGQLLSDRYSTWSIKQPPISSRWIRKLNSQFQFLKHKFKLPIKVGQALKLVLPYNFNYNGRYEQGIKEKKRQEACGRRETGESERYYEFLQNSKFSKNLCTLLQINF